jgi:hypothetical protein
METVAEFLTASVAGRKAPDEKDQFGRSAFNRYYYASFLLVRESLVEMHDAWKSLAHKAFPEVLEGQIIDRLKGGKRSAIKAGDKELTRICSVAIDAAKDLASLMKEGYAVRIVADYDPSSRIAFSGNSDFSLNSITISQAKRWAPKARILSGQVVQAWRQLIDE